MLLKHNSHTFDPVVIVFLQTILGLYMLLMKNLPMYHTGLM